MTEIIECVPNFSEGRDSEKIKQILDTITAVDGVTLLDHQSDPDHNRTVVTIVGNRDAVFNGAFEGIKKAKDLIDLTKHKGEHPRMGATDVCPFIPISDITMEDCVELAKKLAEKVWKELEIPSYLYEAAASRPERENLAIIRKGQFEGIRDEIATNPDRKPDFGNNAVHPTFGIMAIGARPILIAFNVNLDREEVGPAATIGRAVRHSTGGFRYVKAMGFTIDEKKITQVSMNMVNYEGTPLYRSYNFIKGEADRYGIPVIGSEIVGLTPLKAFTDVAQHFLRIQNDIPTDKITWEEKYDMDISFKFSKPSHLVDVAKAISEETGGLRGVKATVDGEVIKIHIDDAKITALHRVFNLTLVEIERYGATIEETLVDTIPMEIIVQAADFFLRIEDFKLDQILEYKLRQKK